METIRLTSHENRNIDLRADLILYYEGEANGSLVTLGDRNWAVIDRILVAETPDQIHVKLRGE